MCLLYGVCLRVGSVEYYTVCEGCVCVFCWKTADLVCLTRLNAALDEWHSEAGIRRRRRMRFGFLAAIVLGCFGLTSCGEIQQTSTINTAGTSVGNAIIATRGDAVVEVVNRESMPNAFGAADIFGRTRATGTTSLIFVGGADGAANFIRRDVNISSHQTTMNSSPIVIQNNSTTTFSGYANGRTFSGTANTYNAPIFLPPNTPTDTISGVREIPMSVSVRSGGNTIVIGGTTVTVLSATANELRYTVNK